MSPSLFFFFFQAEDGIRDLTVTGVQTCALPIGSVPNDASKTTSSVIMARIPSTSCAFHTRLKRSTNASPSKVMALSSSVGCRHAPALHRAALEPAKQQGFDEQADEDHGEQAGEE